MRADLATNLDLKTLAAESGYSRNQFLVDSRARLTFHVYSGRLLE